MVAIFQTTFSNAFFMEMFEFRLQFLLKFVPMGPIDNPALVQLMAWRGTAAKPLPDPMVT